MDYDEDPRYLDKEAISTQMQNIDCVFRKDMPGLEFLHSGNLILKNTKLSLPFWVAKILYVNNIVDIPIPSSYNPNFGGIVAADPTIIDLHKKGPEYYRFGKLLTTLERETETSVTSESPVDKPYLNSFLKDLFHARHSKLISCALDNRKDEVMAVTADMVPKLDNLELKLYYMGKRLLNEKTEWEIGQKQTSKHLKSKKSDIGKDKE